MNFTRQYFIDQIIAKYPKYYSSLQQDVFGNETLFVSSDPIINSHNATSALKEHMSEFIWRAGKVIKDSLSLFSVAPQTHTIGYTTVKIQPHNPAGVAGNNTFMWNTFMWNTFMWNTIMWNTIPSGGISVDYGYEDKTTEFRKTKCECGAESVGSNSHSSWCEKDNT